ncbi:hypothetical protein EB796_010517 [Bugula neritina]|uniref:Uncharacterized protein n=1 Tax=Bugula neritina TaxID=10212 RepID=A0A7J7JXN7_BUGNE|nr:hypothetical protein EB796_010517 [Bugula neritina]
MQQQQIDGEERTTRQILEDQKKFLINYRASLEERRRQLLLPKTNDVMTMGQRDSITPKPGIEIIVSRHSVTSNSKRDQQQGQLPKINTISTRDSGETTPVIITGHKNKPAVPQFLDVLQCKAKTNKPGFLLTPNRKYRVENWLNSISMS